MPSRPAPVRGGQLRALRRQLGYSLAEFADLIGVTKSYVSKLERGALPVPGPVRLLYHILKANRGAWRR